MTSKNTSRSSIFILFFAFSALANSSASDETHRSKDTRNSSSSWLGTGVGVAIGAFLGAHFLIPSENAFLPRFRPRDEMRQTGQRLFSMVVAAYNVGFSYAQTTIRDFKAKAQ